MKEIIDKYTVKYDKKVKQICAPLVECLGIPVFTYFRLDSSGQFVILGNFAAQLEYYYDQQLFQANPYLVDPELLQSGCVILADTPDPEFLDTIERSKKMYHLDNTFLILEKSGDTVEGFFFGTRSPNASPIYLHRLDLLKKFNHYFTQKAAPIIKQMEGEGFNLKQVKGSNFLKRSPDCPLSNHDPRTKNFLKCISPLSKRERECLELFRQGHSAQAAAARLNLSRRTVEHYYENIKNKLGCTSKWDLLNLG